MASICDKFRKTKLDQSPYLFHFTSGEDCKSILKTILKEQRLISNNKDYICFTASPITQVGEFFNTLVNATGQPMYQPYGIGFSRNILIREYGAKNVIYGDADDEETIEKCGMGWRFLKLDVDRYDFEWLREWRLSGSEFNFSKFPKEHMIVIVPTDDEILDFVTKEYYVQYSGYDATTGKQFEDLFEKFERIYKGTSLESIHNKNILTDYQVSGSTVTQIIGHDMSEEMADLMAKRTIELNDAIAKSVEDFLRVYEK